MHELLRHLKWMMACQADFVDNDEILIKQPFRCDSRNPEQIPEDLDRFSE